MTFHAFRIFNKQGTCLFRHSWGVDVEDEDARKMLFGLLFSLKQFVVKMDPKEVAANPCSFHAFRTNNYKLHFLETASGLMFLLTTDPSSPDMKARLLQFAAVHDDLVVKNAIWRGEDSQPARAEYPPEYVCADLLDALTKHITQEFS